MPLDLTGPDGPRPPVFTRRGLALVPVFAGYCAAAGPAMASAITTDSEGLITEMVAYPSLGFDLPAYVARPAAAGRRPAIVVVSEIFGLHAYIQDVCRRFAKLGYVAIAPAYFVRAGDPAAMTDFAAIRPVVAKATHAQVMADTDATVAWLRQQRFVARNRLGITGFCWGGAVTWMAAAHTDAFRAGVAWYGRLTRPARDGFLGAEERPWPVDVAGALRAPVLGLYAENDAGIPLADVEAMRAALIRAGEARSTILIYPGAQHGFHADYRPAYLAAAAQNAWAHCLHHFQTNGV
jgi:carboxymethylenebutenolidase